MGTPLIAMDDATPKTAEMTNLILYFDYATTAIFVFESVLIFNLFFFAESIIFVEKEPSIITSKT